MGYSPVATASSIAGAFRGRARGGGGQGAKALMRQKKTEDDARNKQFEAILKRQREMQAKLMEQARGQIAKSGAGRRQDIRTTGVQRQGQATQSLTSRGLGNTTIVDSVRRGINTQTERGITSQRDLEAGQMSGLYSREAGMQLGEGQFQLGGIQSMSGGLDEYIAMLTKLGGGLS